MQKFATLIATILLAFAPHAAFAVPLCQVVTTTTEDQHFSSEDDPDIPNCVMFPTGPYPNGVCERVLQWTNYGSSSTTVCALG